MNALSGILHTVAEAGLVSIEAIQRWTRDAERTTGQRLHPLDAVLRNITEINEADWIHTATVGTGLPYHPIGNAPGWVTAAEHSTACLEHYQHAYGIRLYTYAGIMNVGLLDASAEGIARFQSYYEKTTVFRFFVISPQDYLHVIGHIKTLALPPTKLASLQESLTSPFGPEVPYIKLHRCMVLKEELTHVDLEEIEAEQIIPLRRCGPALWVAAVNEGWSEPKKRRLRAILAAEPKAVFVEKDQFDAARQLVLQAVEEIRRRGKANLTKARMEVGTDSIKNLDVNRGRPDEVFKQILAQAVEEGASDLHIERKDTGVFVRMRIDGVPETFTPLDNRRGGMFVEFIRSQTGLYPDTATGTGMADANYSLAWTSMPRRLINLRLASITQRTDAGTSEKLTIRVLDPKNVRTNLDDTGIDPPDVRILRRALAKEKGLVLVTGPTGSGKSTTLFAAVSELAGKECKRHGRDNVVYTIEQPIEYTLDGAYQIEVGEKSSSDFAGALRALMRHDPDVILVGEIRDPETAELALKASDTGHLVLSTLHTNDTIGVINRLTRGLGVNREQLIENLVLATAQRLYPKRCPKCRRQDEKKRWFNIGCTLCQNRGRKGRIMVIEALMLADFPAVREMLMEGKSDTEVRRALKEASWQGYAEKAKRLSEEGVIDIEEDEFK